MFEKFKIKDYNVELSKEDIIDIRVSVGGTTNRDCIIKDYIETTRIFNEAKFRLTCLKDYMAYIDAHPVETYIRIYKNRHFTALQVGLFAAPKGFEGPLYCNLAPIDGYKEFEGKFKKDAFDYAIELVKAHPGGVIICAGDIYPNDLPARVRPFANYTYDAPKEAKKNGS